MKRSFITHGLLIASLLHGLSSVASAQMTDLPNPDVPQETELDRSIPPFDMNARTYAGSLRLSGVSRKTDGTTFRIVLSEPTRLLRMDLRVSSGKAKVREAVLVTTSGNRIAVRDFQNTEVIEISVVQRSENFSLNEPIAEIELKAEAFEEDANMILTALSESTTPQLSLWQPLLNTTTPSYVAGKTRTPRQELPTASEARMDKNCSEGYCVGDVVLFQRQRGKIIQVYANGRVLVLQRQVRKILTSPSELSRPRDF